jgi:hypothetical protein
MDYCEKQICQKDRYLRLGKLTWGQRDYLTRPLVLIRVVLLVTTPPVTTIPGFKIKMGLSHWEVLRKAIPDGSVHVDQVE